MKVGPGKFRLGQGRSRGRLVSPGEPRNDPRLQPEEPFGDAILGFSSFGKKAQDCSAISARKLPTPQL